MENIGTLVVSEYLEKGNVIGANPEQRTEQRTARALSGGSKIEI